MLMMNIQWVFECMITDKSVCLCVVLQDLQKREDIVTKKEAMLAERSELEIKKLRSSQVLNKVLRLVEWCHVTTLCLVECCHMTALWLDECRHMTSLCHIVVAFHSNPFFPSWRSDDVFILLSLLKQW